MRKIASAIALTLSLSFAAAGCGKDAGSSCEKVADHFLELAPKEIQEHVDKKDMIEKCKKDLTAADRKCALSAKDFQALTDCGKKAKKKG